MSDEPKLVTTRRQALTWLGSAALFTTLPIGATTPLAQGLRGRQTQGNLRPVPIAIPPFLGDDPRLAADVTRIITNNLGKSGLFRPLDPSAFIERIRSTTVAPRFADWRAIGAENLVVGITNRDRRGRAVAEFGVWDVVLGKQLTRQRIKIDLRSWRRIGHMISDQVYQKITQETGYFDTRIVFIDERGPKDNRIKRLAVMDQDGANIQFLSSGRERVLTPRFSPTNQKITYMLYPGDRKSSQTTPRVLLMDLETRRQEIVDDYPGMTFAPRFSPDGRKIIMSREQDGISTIVERDLASRRSRPLTRSNAIDTSPCYSPNGRQIVFTSDRGGSQQLYVMSADGSKPRRISFGQGSYSTPVWSPRGDYIAFTKPLQERFLIGVLKPDGSGERILTEGYSNEGPTWAPNGRVLMFFREPRGVNSGPRLYTVDITGYNERLVRTPSFASDPAWSPLLR